jgi:hypothetical protein
MRNSPVNTLLGNSAIGATAPMSGYPQTTAVPSPGGSSSVNVAQTIDGTPLRVATLVVLGIAGLVGLRYWAGFKFNVTVG